jgi:hypothetical protein
MMLEIICLSKSSRPSMRRALNRRGKALGLPALKMSLSERKMRNKTVSLYRLFDGREETRRCELMPFSRVIDNDS